jgi:heme A synthase
MAHFTRIFGVTLIFLGIIPYLATGMESITALIPAFFGIVFLILGIAARKESIYKHMMHGAAVLALLGLFGSGSGLIKVFTLIGGGSVERPDAVISQAVMAVLCIIFLGAAIKSFIDARKAKEA